MWLGNDRQLVDERGAACLGKSRMNSRKIPKTYQCSHCSYSTTNRSDIVKHYRTHTGVKPFACPHCSYQTGDKSNLMQHIRIHTGEKPFSCPYCPYRANRNSSIKNHLRVHMWFLEIGFHKEVYTFICFHSSVNISGHPL